MMLGSKQGEMMSISKRYNEKEEERCLKEKN